jgi:hypothetical protein
MGNRRPSIIKKLIMKIFTLLLFVGFSANSQIPKDPVCDSCPYPGKGQTTNLPIAKHADRALQALHYLYGTDKSTLVERMIWGMIENLDESERVKLRAWYKRYYPVDYRVYAKGMLQK